MLDVGLMSTMYLRKAVLREECQSNYLGVSPLPPRMIPYPPTSSNRMDRVSRSFPVGTVNGL